jgi:hypothetical protein
MTAPDNFLSRWSRRKREATTEAPLGPQPAQARPELETTRTADAAAEAAECASQDEAVAEPSPDPLHPDLEILPSVESITETTDIRGFLRSGVPAELTRSALRRAWTSDASIRDFIGIAENQWDFNDPAAIAGFGPLDGINDAPALLKQALGRIDEAAKAVPDLLPASRATPAAALASRSEVLEGADIDTRSPANQETASDSGAASADSLSLPHRLHGSALPR